MLVFQATTHQFHHFCMAGSNNDEHDELYLWSFNFFSSLSLKICVSVKIIVLCCTLCRVDIWNMKSVIMSGVMSSDHWVSCQLWSQSPSPDQVNIVTIITLLCCHYQHNHYIQHNWSQSCGHKADLCNKGHLLDCKIRCVELVMNSTLITHWCTPCSLLTGYHSLIF